MSTVELWSHTMGSIWILGATPCHTKYRIGHLEPSAEGLVAADKFAGGLDNRVAQELGRSVVDRLESFRAS